MNARLYANENFPLPAVEALRALGYDVLTTRDASQDNKQMPDEEVLAFAIQDQRCVLTLNRKQVEPFCLFTGLWPAIQDGPKKEDSAPR